YHFPARGEMPALKLTWYDGGLRPPRPEELEDELLMGDNGRLLIGDHGKILGGGRGDLILPEARKKEFQDVPKTLPRWIGHYKEWIEACKGGKPGGSNFDWAGPLAETVLLGNVALRLQLRKELTLRKLVWDSEAFRFTNFNEANNYLRREYREGW